MRILALDTATENCSAALLIDGRVLAREERLERGHAERILAMLDELLSDAGLALAALSAIAFGRGPGAFTGVRLAASVAQGLAFGAGLPVVPVSDLRALAQRVLGQDAAAARVLVCLDARMQEVYWGCFGQTAGLAIAVGEEHVGPCEGVQLPAAWSALPTAQAVGSGFTAYPQLQARLAGRVDRVHEGLLPRAEEIARLAASEVVAGRTVGADEALPVYLRDEVVHGGARRH